jgi:hypothetical protein
VKDQVTTNYKHHFLPPNTDMATLFWNERAAGLPRSRQGPHFLFWVGGWGGIFLPIPSHILHISLYPPKQPFPKHYREEVKEGRKNWGQRISESPLLHTHTHTHTHTHRA